MKIKKIKEFEIESVGIPKKYYIQVSTSIREIKETTTEIKNTKNIVARKSKLESREIKKWTENFEKIEENIQNISTTLSSNSAQDETYIKLDEYSSVAKTKIELNSVTNGLTKQVNKNNLTELELLKNNLEELQQKLKIVRAIFVTNQQE